MNWIDGHVHTLMFQTGLSEQKVRELFLKDVRIALAPEVKGNRTYELAYSTAVNLMARIFPNIYFDPLPLQCIALTPWGEFRPLQPENVTRPVSLTLTVGSSSPTLSTHITLGLHDWCIDLNGGYRANPQEAWNPLLAILGAAYAVAASTSKLLNPYLEGAAKWPRFSILDFEQGSAEFDFDEQFDIGVLHIGGIGAVGSAFLYCMLAHGRVKGSCYCFDPDFIDIRNLGRYPLFDLKDLDTAKVVAAASKLAVMKGLDVNPYQMELQRFSKEQLAYDPRFRIEKLISSPDRRETRRIFQNELPQKLWDASTGVDQVVVHWNSYDPTLACAECIYPSHQIETAHLEHMAELLDVPLGIVTRGALITDEASAMISRRYPNLRKSDLVGQSYDSVFQQLCSTQQLRIGDEFVLAPMSFVSAIAGGFLYLEFLKQSCPAQFGHLAPANYFQLNPLFPPNALLRELRSARKECRCQNKHVRDAFKAIWSISNPGRTLKTA